MTFLITFACYGSHLHGEQRGSVDRINNHVGGPGVPPSNSHLSFKLHRMDQPPYAMDAIRRARVLQALQEKCNTCGWNLLAAHVRTNHVHIVVESELKPERLMNEFKSYSSRILNRLGIDTPERKRWARHGSTRWLWNQESISAAISYVVAGQGEPMSVFEAVRDHHRGFKP